DTVLEAVPLASRGRHPKKALVIISDGNDTASRADLREVKRAIRDSGVLVYAVGIDGEPESSIRRAAPQPVPPPRLPFPVPPRFPGWGRGRVPLRGLAGQFVGRGGAGQWGRASGDDRVNAAALRELTDDSGGRTEIVRTPEDLDPATAGIADELSRQYYLGYPAPDRRDGRWHSIRVELKNNPSLRVRARRGYVAS